MNYKRNILTSDTPPASYSQPWAPYGGPAWCVGGRAAHRVDPGVADDALFHLRTHSTPTLARQMVPWD